MGLALPHFSIVFDLLPELEALVEEVCGQPQVRRILQEVERQVVGRSIRRHVVI